MKAYIILALILFRAAPQHEKCLSVSFNRFFSDTSHKYIECLVSNTTDSTFWIMAYAKEKHKHRMQIFPIFDEQIKKNGEWSDGNPGFSGLGLHPEPISPGEKLLFSTSYFDSTAEAVKFGLDIRLREQARRAAREIWTEEIKLR